MNRAVVSLGVAPWTREQILNSLEEFVVPNTEDADYLRQNLEIYQELLPVFPQPWYDEDRYVGATMEPLLREVKAPYQQLLKDEAEHYYWLCYAKIRR